MSEDSFEKVVEALLGLRPLDSSHRQSLEETGDEGAKLLVLLSQIGVESRSPLSTRRLNGQEKELRTGPIALGGWGRYRILERLGQGGFGEVFRAVHSGTGGEVALKLLGGSQPSQGELFLEEARRLEAIQHVNVVRVRDADEHNGRTGFVMELVNGKSLAEIMKYQGRFGADEVVSIGMTLCRALAAAHGANLLHRDIKAQNVLREKGGRIVLVDFGIGCEVDGLGRGSRALSGTLSYMAPELLDNGLSTRSTDLYSLGVLLFYLLTAKFPVQGEDARVFAKNHRLGKRLRLRDLRPDIPQKLVATVEKAIAPLAEDRFSSAAELEEALAPERDPAETPAAARSLRFDRMRWLLLPLLIIPILAEIALRYSLPELFIDEAIMIAVAPVARASHTADRDRIVRTVYKQLATIRPIEPTVESFESSICVSCGKWDLGLLGLWALTAGAKYVIALDESDPESVLRAGIWETHALLRDPQAKPLAWQDLDGDISRATRRLTRAALRLESKRKKPIEWEPVSVSSVHRRNALGEYLEGVTLERAGEYEDAALHFVDAFRADPTFKAASWRAVEALDAEGRFEEGLRYGTQALRLVDDSLAEAVDSGAVILCEDLEAAGKRISVDGAIHSLWIIATAARQRLCYEEALDVLNGLAGIPSEAMRAKRLMALVWEKMGPDFLQEAIDLIEESGRGDTDSVNIGTAALLRAQQGEGGEAARARLSKGRKHWIPYHFWAEGISYVADGDLRKANFAFRQLAQRGYLEYGNLSRAQVAILEERWDDARRLLEGVRKRGALKERSTRNRSLATLLLAEVEVVAGNSQIARSLLKELLDLSPTPGNLRELRRAAVIAISSQFDTAIPFEETVREVDRAYPSRLSRAFVAQIEAEKAFLSGDCTQAELKALEAIEIWEDPGIERTLRKIRARADDLNPGVPDHSSFSVVLRRFELSALESAIH
ncbi:MAG: protein kinase [Acidobacteriota bacterium]